MDIEKQHKEGSRTYQASVMPQTPPSPSHLGLIRSKLVRRRREGSGLVANRNGEFRVFSLSRSVREACTWRYTAAAAVYVVTSVRGWELQNTHSIKACSFFHSRTQL